MFLGLPDDIHEEKPSFLQSKKTHYGPTDQRTDGPTDQRTDRPSYRDARTHLKMRYCREKNCQGAEKFMPYCAICLIAECLISGMLNYRKEKKKVGTFKNMPYTGINFIGGCLIAGFLCRMSVR